MHSRTLPHFLALIGAALIWSTSFVAIKIALFVFPPLTLAAIPFMIAAFLLGVVSSIKGVQRPTRVDIGLLVLTGFLGITIFFCLQNIGIALSTASDAALLVTSTPVITMLLEVPVYRTKLSKIRLLGVGLAMLGVYFVVMGIPLNDGGVYRLVGDILLVACGVAWAFYNFVTRRLQQSYDTLTIIFYQTVAGALAFLPIIWIERSRWVTPPIIPVGIVVYLAVFCCVVGYFLYAYGLKGLDPATAVTMMNLVPVFGLILALLILKEHESLIQLVGGGIMIIGVVISVHQVSNRSSMSQRKRSFC